MNLESLHEEKEMKKPLNISVSMPMKNMIGIIIAVAWVCLHTQS